MLQDRYTIPEPVRKAVLRRMAGSHERTEAVHLRAASYYDAKAAKAETEATRSQGRGPFTFHAIRYRFQQFRHLMQTSKVDESISVALAIGHALNSELEAIGVAELTRYRTLVEEVVKTFQQADEQFEKLGYVHFLTDLSAPLVLALEVILSRKEVAKKEVVKGEIMDVVHMDVHTYMILSEFKGILFRKQQQVYTEDRTDARTEAYSTLLQRSLLDMPRTVKKGSMAEAVLLDQQGSVLRQLGRYKEALSLFERSIEIKRGKHMPLSESLSCREKGLTLIALDQLDAASQSFKQALVIEQQIANRMVLEQRHTGLEREQQERYQEAIGYFEEALEMLPLDRSEQRDELDDDIRRVRQKMLAARSSAS